MNQEKNRAKAVVFDMDGVIFDSEQLVIDCWLLIAEEYGYDPEGVKQCCLDSLGTTTAKTGEIFKKRFGADFPFEERQKDLSRIYHEQADGGKLPMKPGIFSLLKELNEAGIKTAVASSTRKAVVEQELRDAGLRDLFGCVIGGDMLKRSKAAPDIYLMACEAIGVHPAEAFAIEDSYNGVRSASAAGMRPLMVPDLARPTAEMEELAEAVLSSLMEVGDYLRKGKML